MFLDMTIHDFDMARFLIGDEVEEIYTAAGVLVDPEIGEAGDVDTARDHAALRERRHRHDRQQPQGRLRLRPARGDPRQRRLASRPATAIRTRRSISTADSVRRDLPLNFFMDRYTESFATELRAFVDAVLDDKPTPVTGIDGRIPVVMALAARKSYDEHRPVRLEEVA